MTPFRLQLTDTYETCLASLSSRSCIVSYSHLWLCQVVLPVLVDLVARRPRPLPLQPRRRLCLPKSNSTLQSRSWHLYTVSEILILFKINPAMPLGMYGSPVSPVERGRRPLPPPPSTYSAQSPASSAPRLPSSARRATSSGGLRLRPARQPPSCGCGCSNPIPSSPSFQSLTSLINNISQVSEVRRRGHGSLGGGGRPVSAFAIGHSHCFS